jgi:hypothetical protein
MSDFDSVFKSVDLDALAYIPSEPDITTIDNWPSLGEMIANNQRLVVFIGMWI